MSQDPIDTPGDPAGRHQGWGPPPPGWGAPPPAPGTNPFAVPNPGQVPPNGYQQFPPPHPAKPGVLELRPLGLSDLLDGTFAVLRRAPMPTLVNAGVIHVVLGLLGVLALFALGLDKILASAMSLAENPAAFDALPDEFFSTPWYVYVWLGALGAVLYVAAYALVAGPATVAAMRATLNRPTSWREGLVLARPSLATLIGMELLLGIASLIPLAAIIWLTGWLLETMGFIALIPALLVGLVGLVGLIWVGVRLTLVPILIVSQSLSIRAAISRSWRLTRGAWWRVFGIVLVVALVISVLAGLISSVLSIAASLPDSTDAIWFMAILGVLVNALINAVTIVILQVLITLLQVDLRIRNERLDVALLAELSDPAAHPIPGHDAVDYTRAP